MPDGSTTCRSRSLEPQRCTLSQLRSGNCHLLQDYKHMVFGEPSDICTDCGTSPQDVRHLMACNAHPTDLSPEDLWRIRWDRFESSATSTTGTLTDLTTDLTIANNNNHTNPYLYTTIQTHIFTPPYPILYVFVTYLSILLMLSRRLGVGGGRFRLPSVKNM